MRGGSVGLRETRVPSPVAGALLINGARVALGVGFSAAPVHLLRGMGIDSASAARMTWLARTAGVRDAALGLGAVVAVLRRRNALGWVLAGGACDVADVLITAGAARQRRIDPVRGRVMAAAAIGSAVVCAASAASLRQRR